VPRCFACADPCLDCAGSKKNCSLCDPAGNTPALYVIPARDPDAGDTDSQTCRSKCPLDHFMEEIEGGYYQCTQCCCGCASCDSAADDCESCDGTTGIYLFQDEATDTGTCLESCPVTWAEDPSSASCTPCPEHCDVCSS